MPQTATIKSLPVAFEMLKAMQAEDVEWGEDYRAGAREALVELLEGRMDQTIDQHLERMAELGQADRRNGCYRRHLLTELGDLELAVPRTRTFSALKVVRAYARRAKDVDRMILACFVLGLSTRKVAIALLPILGRPVSPATVSAVARQLDAAVAAFHRRPLKDIYRVLVLDGVVLKRKTGAGALARPVLVALGLRPDGRKEVIDFRLASAESAAQWELFLGDLIRRGLTGERLEMLCVDGGAGLLAALPTAYPEVPVQRCWAHKIRNVLAKVRRADQPWLKADLHRIMNAKTLPAAWSAARRCADRWQAIYPKAVACLRADLADHIAFYGQAPRQAAADGSFASRANLRQAKARGVRDMAFHKRGGLRIEDMVRSRWVYRKLRNFRAGIEADISCLKRAYGLARCTWRGLGHFRAYVWSAVVAYNRALVARLKPT